MFFLGVHLDGSDILFSTEEIYVSIFLGVTSSSNPSSATVDSYAKCEMFLADRKNQEFYSHTIGESCVHIIVCKHCISFKLCLDF